MTYRDPNYPERVMLRFPCAYCDAPVGEWCKRRATAVYPAGYLHAPRFYAATAARLLPLTEATA